MKLMQCLSGADGLVFREWGADIQSYCRHLANRFAALSGLFHHPKAENELPPQEPVPIPEPVTEKAEMPQETPTLFHVLRCLQVERSELRKIRHSFPVQDTLRGMTDVMLRYDGDCCVYVDLQPVADDISGAVDYARDELTRIEKDHLKILLVQYERGTDHWSLCPVSVNSGMLIPFDGVMDMALLFTVFRVTKVIVNNLAWSLNAEKAAALLTVLRNAYPFEMEYRFHDHLTVCPSFFLLDANCRPCDPTDPERCASCIVGNPHKAAETDDLAGWRYTFGKFLQKVDRCLFFSRYTRDLVAGVYPCVLEKAVIKHHPPLLSETASGYVRPAADSELHVAYVGHYTMEKGIDMFEAVARKYSAKGIRFYAIGPDARNMPDPFPDIVHTGHYERDELGSLLTEYGIHLVLFPSPANETFSYIVQELMILQVPLVVFPCGAPCERIADAQYDAGEVADEVSAEALGMAMARLMKRIYHRSMD